MCLQNYFAIWEKLTDAQRQQLEQSAVRRTVPAGSLLHNGSADCEGLYVLYSGQLRAFIRSEEGKEMTVYRLFERDLCLLSASCMMNSLQFDILIEAEKETVLWLIPASVYQQLMEQSAVLANYTNQLMATRLSELVWLMEQVMWKGLDQRLADFLMEESAIEESKTLQLTHDHIASHLGSAREVITRLLRRFQTEGLVRLHRGSVEILDAKRLRCLAK